MISRHCSNVKSSRNYPATLGQHDSALSALLDYWEDQEWSLTTWSEWWKGGYGVDDFARCLTETTF